MRLPHLFLFVWDRKPARLASGKELECLPINNRHMSTAANRDDACMKPPAHRRQGYAQVFRDVGTVHRKIDIVRWFAFGGLQLLKQLKEHRQLYADMPVGEQEGMALRLPKPLVKLRDHMEAEIGIL